jgi:hypothetical protein
MFVLPSPPSIHLHHLIYITPKKFRKEKNSILPDPSAPVGLPTPTRDVVHPLEKNLLHCAIWTPSHLPPSPLH